MCRSSGVAIRWLSGTGHRSDQVLLAALEIGFVDRMSERSRYLRFFGAGRGLTPAMLARLTQVDYDRELALIALSGDETEQIVGVARFAANPDGESCEFAVAIDDQ